MSSSPCLWRRFECAGGEPQSTLVGFMFKLKVSMNVKSLIGLLWFLFSRWLTNQNRTKMTLEFEQLNEMYWQILLAPSHATRRNSLKFLYLIVDLFLCLQQCSKFMTWKTQKSNSWIIACLYSCFCLQSLYCAANKTMEFGLLVQSKLSNLGTVYF